MIGKQVTLQDIVLQEDPPENVILTCDEELPPEEELEQEQVHGDSFKVQVHCPHCDSVLCLAVLCSLETIRRLETLLIRDLRFVCQRCASRNYNGF